MKRMKIFIIGCFFLTITGIQSQTFINDTGMKMLPVKAGTFLMGNPGPAVDEWDEIPRHYVTISTDFFMSETEITLEQYRLFKPDHSSADSDGFVTGVSWHEAVAFCEWLTEKEAREYRLPTEAEWEYAARAGTESPFWSGDKPPEMNAANPLGLKNVHSGPVEWCLDEYADYQEKHVTDPLGKGTSGIKVIRGGGLDEQVDKYARSANRAGYMAGFRRPAPEEKDAGVNGVTEEPVKAGLAGLGYGSAELERVKEMEVIHSLDLQWMGEGSRGNDWSAEYTGFLTAPADGNIEFSAMSDYGITFEIGDQRLIHWRGEAGERKASVQMQKGKNYRLYIIYNHVGGERSELKIRWRWGERDWESIPSSEMKHSPLQYAELQKKSLDVIGPSSIGFRVVQGPLPAVTVVESAKPFVSQCIVQVQPRVKQGPDPSQPYFKKRPLLPIPPDNTPREQARTAGFFPGMMDHNHSPALEVCPNGDVYMVIYTSEHEYEPEVSLIATRLRFGAEEWDMPEMLVNIPDVNDHAPCLFTENERMWLFWGNPRLEDAMPFQWMTSDDNGATWSEVHVPEFEGPIGPHSKQPINTVIRAEDGTLYLSSDAAGGTSVLWGTKDEGKTWFDTGGRTGGRHTTFAMLKDGRILGMGGKNTDIDGYMPKSISSDGGKTWKVSITPFSEQGSNQRPCLIRLQSGRLFFCGDFQHRSGRHPEAITERGSYVALSEDEGETWHIKKLIGTQTHESDKLHDTIGYSAARQAPNGVIHLISTMNTPCLHFEMNEAWILDDEAGWVSEDNRTGSLQTFYSNYPDGALRSIRRGGLTADGRFLLHGDQAWYYPDGSVQWTVSYEKGRKTGKEIVRRPGGGLFWMWDHYDNGYSTWTQFWPDGIKKARSAWKGLRLDGEAVLWDRTGVELMSGRFSAGELHSVKKSNE